MRTVLRFWANDSASTAIEYAFIAAGIAVAIVAAVQALGTGVNGMYSLVSTSLK
jgi:pilus assembly protein Flp/PilA